MKNKRRLLCTIVFILSALSCWFAGPAGPALAAADAYPSRLVRMVIPGAPGASSDIAGRLIATKLAEHLGKPVVVENHAGAGGVLGTEMVAKAVPDGYTLMTVGPQFTTSTVFYKLPYDPVNSFTPIAKLAVSPQTLFVHPSVPANSVKELIALAKQKPGELSWACSGVGSMQHMQAELFKAKAGIDVKIVQFKGGGAFMNDVLGGHSQIGLAGIIQAMPFIKTGKIKALGVVSKERSSFVPDMPTISESGLPGVEVPGWWGVLAPAGTPAPIIDRLANEIETILASADLKKFLLAQGAEMDYLGPTEFRAFLVSEIAQWQQVAKEANIKIEK